MFFQIASLWCMYVWSVQAAVLDPSLYLSPSPPLTDTSGSISAAELWSRPPDSRGAREVQDTFRRVIEERPATKRKPQPMEKAKFFWPSLRSSQPHYSLGTGNIQVPLTFSLSGLYGKYSPGQAGSGVIGSSYGTVSEIGGTVASGLAGSGYGKYQTYSGLRIYGGENGPAWSGWGNGKWGNYGKG